MYPQHYLVNWVIDASQGGDKVLLFPLWCYCIWVYWSTYKGDYVVTTADHDYDATHDELHDFYCTHDPKLASKLSSIGVLILWFTWYPPSSLYILRQTVGFDSTWFLSHSYFCPVRTITSLCETSHRCRCFVCLKAVHSFKSDVTSSSDKSRGGLDGSGGRSIPVAFTRRCVGVLLARLIM